MTLKNIQLIKKVNNGKYSLTTVNKRKICNGVLKLFQPRWEFDQLILFESI